MTTSSAPEMAPLPECADLLNRLRRAEGQLKAVINMIETRRNCDEVATQMAAAKAAVEKAAMALVLVMASSESTLAEDELTRLALPLA